MELIAELDVKQEPLSVAWCDSQPRVVTKKHVDWYDFGLSLVAHNKLELPKSKLAFNEWDEVHHLRGNQFLMSRSAASNSTTNNHDLVCFNVEGKKHWQWNPNIPFSGFHGQPFALSSSSLAMSCGSDTIYRFDEASCHAQAICDVAELPFPDENALTLLGVEPKSGQILGLWMSDWNVVELGIWQATGKKTPVLDQKTYQDSYSFSFGSFCSRESLAYVISTDVMFDFCVCRDGKWTEVSLPDDGRYHLEESLPFLFDNELYFFSASGTLLHFDFERSTITEVSSLADALLIERWMKTLACCCSLCNQRR